MHYYNNGKHDICNDGHNQHILKELLFLNFNIKNKTFNDMNSRRLNPPPLSFSLTILYVYVCMLSGVCSMWSHTYSDQ